MNPSGGGGCLASEAMEWSDTQAAVENWPTPRVEDAEACGQHPGAADALNKTAENWTTPHARDADKWHNRAPGHPKQVNLSGQVAHWPAPGANDHKGSAKVGQRRGQLDEAAEQKWQSPGAMGGGSTSRGGDRIGETLIAGQASSLSTLLAPAPSSTGDESSPSAPTSRRRLNPLFVEWLMGLPSGHTDLTGCEPAATAFTLWWPRMRSALSGLVCATSDP